MNTVMSIRTDTKLKKKAQTILAGYGLNISSAFNMYLSDVVNKRVEPSCNRRYVPSHIMQRWEDEIVELKKNKNHPSFSNVDELMKYLND
jgi:addiction module RelB/DinJ family antitoxin